MILRSSAFYRYLICIMKCSWYWLRKGDSSTIGRSCQKPIIKKFYGVFSTNFYVFYLILQNAHFLSHNRPKLNRFTAMFQSIRSNLLLKDCYQRSMKYKVNDWYDWLIFVPILNRLFRLVNRGIKIVHNCVQCTQLCTSRPIDTSSKLYYPLTTKVY